MTSDLVTELAPDAYITKGISVCTPFSMCSNLIDLENDLSPAAGPTRGASCYSALSMSYDHIDLMPTVEHLLLECPMRVPHLRMGCSDWTLQQQLLHCWHKVICTWHQGKCYLINDNMQEYSVAAAFLMYILTVFLHGRVMS
jgi:hypothetical protein